ncbi:ShlB/FhaC/HecB family hemolysin secretion/activation protein [Herbaspirillum lusitanum]|uniref:ShlB/FhaC/HecB family hemolysin secretion/activation protein n=1 Tax=Herbaspirillum lusitanum TaxID=213312 RepID=UPI002238AEB0|nr:ShlB/FhaC/HecB family hemolysin secretion/activation protein [Herbaspirillum lusitanum]
MTFRFARLVAGSVLATAAGAAWSVDPPAPGSLRFEINRFAIAGNTLLPAADVDAAVAPFTGKDRDFSDVKGALVALKAVYQAHGYVLVRIDLPEQELNNGVVVLNVVQTRIGNVAIEGNKSFTDTNIRNSLPGLQEGEAPDLNKISKSLKLANENPAKKTVMKIKPGAAADEVDASLAVTEESVWLTTLNLDNSGTEQVGRTYAGVVLQNANMFGRDHVMTLQYTTTLEHSGDVAVYGFGYHVPLYALGDSLDFFASHSDVNAGTVTAGILDIAVSGKGSMYGARYNQNLTTVGSYESKLVYGIDYKEVRNSMQTLGIELGNDVTVHPLSVGYVGNWSMQNGVANWGATLSHNVAGGAKGRQQDFDAARVGAKADYTALRFAASTTQGLPQEWLARAIVNGQYTRDALIAGEQYGAGGASSVRGFQEREVSNDSGVTANVEIYSPPLCRNTDWQCRVLAFYDTAYLTRNRALPGEFRSMAISSIGVGVRLQLRNNVSLQMDYGHVLRAEATVTQRGDGRLHARLGLSF